MSAFAILLVVAIPVVIISLVIRLSQPYPARRRRRGWLSDSGGSDASGHDGDSGGSSCGSGCGGSSGGGGGCGSSS